LTAPDSFHFLSTDESAVTVRFNLKDGSEFGYVRADRFEQLPNGVYFILGMDVVASLGPLTLVIYRYDGTEQRVDRDRLAEPPFVVSGNAAASLLSRSARNAGV
jgi:hypothetical protein